MKTLSKILLSVLSLAFTFLLLEAGTRLWHKEFSGKNFWEAKRNFFHSNCPAIFDKDLGWVPGPAGSSAVTLVGNRITIAEHGIRSNDESVEWIPPKKGSPFILAAGDSYTFGDGVSDGETWPAYLEKKTGRRVVNGGVFAYGFDQSYLRMRDLDRKLEPSAIILSLIPDDISRCGLSSRRGVTKPYFSFTNGVLEVHKDHVTPPVYSKSENVFRILGYSFFIHQFMTRFFPAFWMEGAQRSVKVDWEGQAVACPIIKEIRAFLNQTPRIKQFILLIQYPEKESPERMKVIKRFLDCARANKLQVVDLHNALAHMRKEEPAYYKTFFDGHMTAAGNEWVADVLTQALSQK